MPTQQYVPLEPPQIIIKDDDGTEVETAPKNEPYEVRSCRIVNSDESYDEDELYAEDFEHTLPNITVTNTATGEEWTFPGGVDVEINVEEGGMSKFVYNNAFTSTHGGTTRWYAGSSLGGVNNYTYNYFRDLSSGLIAIDAIYCGIAVNSEVENLSFTCTVVSTNNSGFDLTAKLYKMPIPADGTLYNAASSSTQIATGTKTISANNTIYTLTGSGSTTVDSTEVLLFGLDGASGSTNIRCKFTITGDYTGANT